MFTRDDVDAARTRVRDHVHLTPLLSATRIGADAGVQGLALKCENLQRTGSFKARGALNAMMQLSDAERARGVVTVSAGNHAQALSWAAARVGAECVTVMPESAPKSKIAATRGYGGKVELVAGERARVFARAHEIADAGRTLVHPFEDARVAAGQGTVGVEILEQQPRVTHVVVPIGGGGLISGIAVAIKSVRPDVKIYGVEPRGAATMRTSLDAGSPQTINPETIADGLAAPMVGEMTLDIVRRHVEDVVIVSDDEIAAAMRAILSCAKMLTEPAGAAGVAALLQGRIPLEKEARVVVVLSGGNVDLERVLSS